MSGTKRAEVCRDHSPAKRGGYPMHLRSVRPKETRKVDPNISSQKMRKVETLCGVMVSPRETVRHDRKFVTADMCDSCATRANLDLMFGSSDG